MKTLKKFIAVILAVTMVLSLGACSKKAEVNNDDIIIIYTSDVHGIVDENIGYAGLVAYKKQAEQQSQYVTMVDVGDATQGTSIATVSKGEAILECMQAVGYDIHAIGNHDFDFGLDETSSFIGKFKDKFINSNVVYTGKDETNTINKVDKYKIIEYGDIKVGYIGLLTPHTLVLEAPILFKENDEVVVDFYGGQADKDFYGYIQKLVDEVKAQGADYVVALSHIGDSTAEEPFTSTTLAKSTKGIDVIIDAHSHSLFASKSITNAENKQVLVTACGTQLQSIGQVTISKDGYICATNITEYEPKDKETAEKIKAIKDKYTANLDATIFNNKTPLTIYDNAGIRLVRSQEMPIGDLVADSLRYVTEADISLANGGGIRSNLPKGDISFSDIIKVSPFGNGVASIELTGQEILDYLEYCYRFTKPDPVQNGKNNNEYGSFMQISGLKLTIDSSITPDVVVDIEDNLISVGEKRRLKDVMVLQDGQYVPIDPTKTYIVGSYDYILFEGGSGTEQFFQGKKQVLSNIGTDYDILASYITDTLSGDLSAYSESAGRITIK